MKLALRLTLLSVAMLLFTFNARAGSITEEQARAKAQSFLQTLYQSTDGKRLAAARTPAELYSTSTGVSSLYVFNIGERDGFVIVSGDDRVRPILGYTDSGTFDADKVPAALHEMMSIYARQIESLGQTKASTDSIASASNSRRRISGAMADVSPLMTTTWNQTAPYNNYCPTLNDQTALTGCVATAMAQIAYYHKYPATQVPSLSAYTSTTNAINVSAWGATTFDWDNMLTSYDGSETSTQIAAVATLMRYCGQAAQMDYGFSSGAYNGDARYALVNKLGYYDGATFKSASAYTTDGWEDLIYKEVHEGRPVYYSALNGDENGAQCGGHAFVIDGYKADGNYFHVNWGWGGYADGYFNLFALDPSAPEWDATATGWHYQMLALVGLSPKAVNIAKLTQDASGSWLITSADDWNELSTNLEAYNGGTFKLTNDISVTTMVGTESLPFSGTFDGQGHTLTVNIEGNTWGVAPFNYVNVGTAIKNLKTQGTVTSSNFHSSGLIGGTGNSSSFGISITNCEVAVQVNGTDYAGGFIGHAVNMQPVFTDCSFSGSINGCDEHGCFVGWKEWTSRPVYVNCFSIPVSFNQSSSYDFSHPGNGGSTSHATFTNCYSYYPNGFRLEQGMSASSDQLSDGTIAYALQSGQRDWTTGMVWGQLLGTDAVPVLTADAGKRVNKVSFAVDGQVQKTVFCNSTIGDKMPEGDVFGLTNATFTCAGATFTSTTPVTSDITVTVTGTPAYTLTLNTPTNGTIVINNSSCVPGTLKKITAAPASGYVVSSVTATDASGNVLPVTQVSNARNEFVFAFPKSSVTVNATFAVGEAEAVRFINEGMTLPSSSNSRDQHWTADTWMIWGDAYDGTDNVIVGAPPVDALGHQWYEEGYALTNNDTDVLPNGNKIVWENHAASFWDGGNYDYYQETGGGDCERTGDFYIRRIFTFNTTSVPSKLFLSCSYDDSPVEYYINGTLVYEDHKTQSWHNDSYEVELSPAQIALIHTDGTPNVLAVHVSQNWGGYHLDCGLYDPTALVYAVTGESKVRVTANHALTGDVVIPETVTYDGVTYTVTAIDDEATNDMPYLTSISLPMTITSLGTYVFVNDPSLLWVKAYCPVYQKTDEKTLVAAPADVTEYELPDDCQRIWNNAFKFTDKLQTLTLPRSLTEICENAFIGCMALKDIYAYPRPVPNTSGDAFDGIVKTGITVHVYESALDGYKDSWGEDFTYVTMTDPQTVTLTINVTEQGTLAALISEVAAEMASTAYDVTGITVTGSINQDDLSALATMCTGAYSLASIDLSGVVITDNYIGNSMFYEKEKLVSIVLPETLEYIEGEAFYNCDGLTAIDIPASVKFIESYAFADCENLATVTGMEGLSSTDVNFYEIWDVFNWTAITEPVYGGDVFLYMPPTVTGEYEVPAGIRMTTAGSMRYSQLSAITLPASLIDLGDDTFEECSNLVDIYCYAPTPPTCHDGVWEFGFDYGACTVHVPESVVADYQSADEWNRMGRIVGITTGELVDMTLNVATAGTLDDDLFNDAVAAAEISDKVLIRNLTVTGSINADDVSYLNALPGTLYNIETLDLSGTSLDGNAITERMFYQTLYKSIMLPEGVTSIASEAFYASRRLQEVTLPAAVETIASNTFSGCSALTTVTFAENSTLKRIEESAFNGLSSLTSITLPKSLEYIGPFAFANTGLTSITIPDGVTELGHRGVQSCGSLTSVTLGNGLATIPDCWAEFCNNLKEVTIGSKVTRIDWRAFYGGNIQNVYCYAKTAPSWNDSFYDGINSEAVLHTYSNCVSRYEKSTDWQNFPTITGDLGTYATYDLTVNVADYGGFSEALAAAMTAAGCMDMIDISQLTVTGYINSDDLYYLRDYVGKSLDKLDLSEVTVENNYTFGHEVLAWCNFEEVLLPANLEYISGWYVLDGCPNIKTIHIPSTVRFICPAFLRNATSLETVTGGDGIVDMESYYGMYFDNCPSLTSPVILNHFFFRMNESFSGAYELPEHVTAIARDGMEGATGLTALTLHENLTTINGYAFSGDENLKDIYFYTTELPSTDREAFVNFDCTTCTLHVYEEMVEVFQASDLWNSFNIVGDLGNIPVVNPIADADYADLCSIYNTLGGSSWRTKWVTGRNVQMASRWSGVTFDEEGYVTAIDLKSNSLSGDISELTFTGMTHLTSLNLSRNALTGDIQPLIASLPTGCTLNVERQELGYIGDCTLYDVCRISLSDNVFPSIAFYNYLSGTLASTLVGVGDFCQFYHKGTDGVHYWDSYITSNGGTINNYKFYWPSPTTVECMYPHHFTFTYTYSMGDANMDDALNVLDLQTTLNYSNNQSSGLFNFYAADTYGPDDDINVQDIVATVNILLAQEESGDKDAKHRSNANTLGTTDADDNEAYVCVENGQLVLYTTRPVAAIEMRLAGIDPDQLHWCTDEMGFMTASMSQTGGTHAIIYSMSPREIAVGRTVLAEFDANAHTLSPYDVVLSDSMAHRINVGMSIPTGIVINKENMTGISVHDLLGRKLSDSQLRQGLYIVNGRKVIIK